MTTSTGRPIQARDPSCRVRRRRACDSAAFGQEIGDEDDRPGHLRERFLDTPDEQRRHEAREEAPRSDDDGVKSRDGLGHDRVNRHVRLEPHALHVVAARLPGVHLNLAPRLGAVAVLRTDGCGLDADRPNAVLASEQYATGRRQPR